MKNIKKTSRLALIGILIPFGILAKIYFGAPPIFVLLGAFSIIIAVIWLEISFLTMKKLN